MSEGSFEFVIATNVSSGKPYPDTGERVPDIEGIETVLNRQGATCGGDQPIGKCETTRSMLNGVAQYYAHTGPQPYQENEGYKWNLLAWLSKRCGECTQACDVAAQTRNGEPTERMRMSFSAPDPNSPNIKIDISKYGGVRPVE